MRKKQSLNVSIDEYLINAFKQIARLKGWSLSYTINLSLESVYYEIIKPFIEEEG